MSEDSISEAAPISVKEKGKKKAKGANAYPTKLAEGPTPAESAFDFIGRVETLNVKGTGIGSNEFLFVLVDKKGTHNSYLLDPSESLRFSAMASLLTAAYISGAKVRVRSAPNGSVPRFAGEIEVRNKG